MQDLGGLERVLLLALPVLFAVTLHEIAHGLAAKRLGDDTAEKAGRLSLNPLKHVDPIGTVLLPALLIWVGGLIFGWAKPVPVNPGKLGHPKRDAGLVALAGPMANLMMLFLWAIGYKLASLSADFHNAWLMEPLLYVAAAGMQINAILLVLNLLPIPPLDGARVLGVFLPNRWSAQLSRLEHFGMLILIVLLLTGILAKILSPILDMVIAGFRWIFGF